MTFSKLLTYHVLTAISFLCSTKKTQIVASLLQFLRVIGKGQQDVLTPHRTTYHITTSGRRHRAGTGQTTLEVIGSKWSNTLYSELMIHCARYKFLYNYYYYYHYYDEVKPTFPSAVLVSTQSGNSSLLAWCSVLGSNDASAVTAAEVPPTVEVEGRVVLLGYAVIPGTGRNGAVCGWVCNINIYRNPSVTSNQLTRKPCYRKDDRAMRPIYGCPKKFWESSQTPPATFPKICEVLLFRSILRMYIQNLKFVAVSFPEIIGSTQKIWAVPVYAHTPVSPKFLKGFCSYGPSEYICQIWSS